MQQTLKARKQQIKRSIERRSTATAAISSPILSVDNEPAASSRTIQISTTVGNDTAIHFVPLKRLNEVEQEDVNVGLPGIAACAPDRLGGSESETEFEEDFVLVEDTPACIGVSSTSYMAWINLSSY